MGRMRKVAVLASASGNGKTVLGRALAGRLGVPFVELDALVHGPGWVETPDALLRSLGSRPIVAGDGWVVDGGYREKLGDLVLRNADTVVWLDLPLRVWLPRLLRRTWRRWRGKEQLWNDNRERLWEVVWGRDSLLWYELRAHFDRRRRYPGELAGYPVVHLRSSREVGRFLDGAA